MPLLSVAVVTLNEEENLRRTLASVQWADEIVVVDSGSSDATVEIARSFGATVIVRPWAGFAAQKNFAIAQCSGDWVLSLDADEELTPELQTQVRAILPSNPPVDAYCLRRRNLFLGRWIRHGGFYPDPKLRLFRRCAATFAATPQFEDRPVHETITFDGAADTLDFDIIHHAYPTLSHYIEHMDRYSSMGGELLAEHGAVGMSLESFVLGAFVLPQLKFLWTYVFLLGFLDGREGLLLHLYHATYTSWKYTKAWERMRAMNRSPSVGVSDAVEPCETAADESSAAA